MKWIVRIGGLLLALLVLSAAVLLGMGQRASAGRVHASTEVNVAPQQLWPWLTEPDRLKQWIGGLVEIRGHSDSTRIGAKEIWVVRDEHDTGKPMEIEGSLTEAVPFQRLSVTTVTPGLFDGGQTYRLTDLGGRTRLDIDGHFRYFQWFARLLEPVITPSAERKLSDDLARLKSLAERPANAAN